ncbi:MAG: adenine methylase [Clostridia bacterium]|nr:adenine methylase [Clostridia bacterium]
MRPFLKWPGNKYRIVNYIKAKLPNGNRLIEPFVGSGSVFLNTNYNEYLLADNNEDLINLYITLQKEGENFISFCRSFFIPDNNTKEKYYYYRRLFNITKDPRLKSALLIYLNRHGYNGLVRYNKNGVYNVPFGKYKRPYFPEAEMHYFWYKSQKAIFIRGDFKDIMAKTCRGDVIYCDPPYVPLSNTSNFTNYSTGGFTLKHQHELTKLALKLSNQDIPVLISNHDTKLTRLIYKNADITRIKVQRYISCNGAKRTKVNEILAFFKGKGSGF